MKKSTKKSKIDKPPKPYPDFPLTPHNLGYWCKSIKGDVYYFGKWGKRVDGKLERIPGDGWKEALELYEQQREDLYAGRKPQLSSGALTVADLCNRYLTAKQHLLDNDELSPRTFFGYKAICVRIAAVFGKRRLVTNLNSNDFGQLRLDIAQTNGPVRLGNEIQRVRSVFKFGYDEGLIDRPVRYGQQFNKPSRKTLRQNRAKNGKRMFEAEELRTIIDAATLPLRAMILLGINCGFGQSDLSNLPKSALDLENGWAEYPRPKTGVERRCCLWPETIEAVRDVIENHPQPKNEEDEDLVFITIFGNRWVKVGKNGSPDDGVGQVFTELLKKLKLKRPGVSFYALRHTFQTIGEEAGETATRHIMGHVDSSMSAVYRERISDERLIAVTNTVRSWLWPETINNDDDEKSELTKPKLRIVG